MLPTTGVFYFSPDYSREEMVKYFQTAITAQLSISNDAPCDIQVNIYSEGLLNVFRVEIVDAPEPYVLTSSDRKIFDSTDVEVRNNLTPQDDRLQSDNKYFKDNVNELFASAKAAVKTREDANEWEIRFSGQGIELVQQMGFSEEVKHRITVKFYNLENLYIQNQEIIMQKLANIFAYFEAGKKPLLEKIHLFEECGLDPNKLPLYTDNDLKFICFELKIDYQEFRKLLADSKKGIDLNSAKTVFSLINVAALLQFSASQDNLKLFGSMKRNYFSVREAAFRTRLIVLLVQAAGLSLLNESSILFPQPISKEYILQIISHTMSIVYNKPIQFYTQYQQVYENGKTLISIPWSDLVEHSDAKLLNGFILDMHSAFKTIISSDDCFDLAMLEDVIRKIIGWYVQILYFWTFKDYDKISAVGLDKVFWMHLGEISKRILSYNQIPYFKELYENSMMYLQDGKKTKDFKFSPNAIHTTSAEINKWYNYLRNLESSDSTKKAKNSNEKRRTAKAHQYGTAVGVAHHEFMHIRNPNLALDAQVALLNELSVLLALRQPRKNQNHPDMSNDELEIIDYKLNLGRIFHFAFEKSSNVLHILRVIHQFIKWYQLLLDHALSCKSNEHLPYEQVFWAQIPHALDKINKEVALTKQLLPSWQQSTRNLSTQIIKSESEDKLSKVNEFLITYDSVFAADTLSSSAQNNLESLMKNPDNTTILFNTLLQGMMKLDEEILTKNLTLDEHHLTLALRK